MEKACGRPTLAIASTVRGIGQPIQNTMTKSKPGALEKACAYKGMIIYSADQAFHANMAASFVHNSYS
eukprot:1136838-Pelagomonas_calceolata.AAC.7